eukprot:Partr_v1_DN25501_c0_g1_i2_m20481 putative phosphatase 2C
MISRLPPACRSPQGEKKKKLMISETKQGPSTAGRAGTDDGNNSKDAVTSSMPLPAISSGTSSGGGRAYADFKIGFRDDMNRKCRKSMEDAHSYHLDFPVENAGFFAIFDGHAGKNAAQWCGDNLHSLFERNLQRFGHEGIQSVLNRTFMDTNDELGEKNRIHSGCTAVVAFIRSESDADSHKRVLYCANAGDARAVLARSDKAIRMTYDHKGSDPQEIKRIIESGGFIMNSRVNGVLAVTRSLGDISMKDLIVSNPYTTQITLDGDDEFLILACDGVWDVMADQEAVDLIRHIRDPQEAAEAMVKQALDAHSTDNISCMVIRFCHDRTADL